MAGGALLARFGRTTTGQSICDLADNTVMSARLARDLPRWMRTPVTYQGGMADIRARLAARERRFPALVKRLIYDQPSSPYLTLLRHAGCEYGDIAALVAREGVEGTLRILAARGVYVAYDEFKGRRPAVRGSASFNFSAADFDMPGMRPHFVALTGGTGGRPSVVMRTLPFLSEMAQTTAVCFRAHGVLGAWQVFWLTNPLHQMLNAVKLRQDVLAWFHPLDPLPREGRIAGRALAVYGRLLGHRLPAPAYLDAQRPDQMLAVLRRRPRDGRPLIVVGATSSAVRVAVAAQAAGVSLDGVTFSLQSEPVTPARHAQITAVGARAIVNYGAIELSVMGYGCATPQATDDAHVLTHRLALVEHERKIAEDGPLVRALLVSTLSEHSPKLCLNVELGDSGQIEQRACGCALGEAGLTTHLSEIRSFEKLSTEGVTFIRTSVLPILEERLPQQFGGSSLDYQLVEEEGTNTAGRLVLRVHPSVGPLDEQAIRSAFLAALGAGSIVDQHHADLLRKAGSLTVSRQAPLATAAGKVLPFHLLRAPG